MWLKIVTEKVVQVRIANCFREKFCHSLYWNCWPNVISCLIIIFFVRLISSRFEILSNCTITTVLLSFVPLTANSYYFDGGHRYIFPGAEVAPEEETESSDDDDEDDDDDDCRETSPPGSLLVCLWNRLHLDSVSSMRVCETTVRVLFLSHALVLHHPWALLAIYRTEDA